MAPILEIARLRSVKSVSRLIRYPEWRIRTCGLWSEGSLNGQAKPICALVNLHGNKDKRIFTFWPEGM